MYAGIAQRLLEGKTYVDNFSGTQVGFPPLYPLLIQLLSLITRDLVIAGRLASFLMGLGLIVAVFDLARQLYGERTATLAATLVTFMPDFVMLSGSVYSEAIYITLLVAGAYWGAQSLRGKGPKTCVLAGLFFGLAYLARLEGAIYPFLTVPFILAAAWIERRGWKQPLLACLVIVGAFTFVAVPYVVFLSRHLGRFAWEGKGANQYIMGQRMNSGMNWDEAAYGTDDQLSDAGPQLNFDLYARKRAPVRVGEFLRFSFQSIARSKDAAFKQIAQSSEFGSPLLAALVVLGLLAKPWSREQTFQQLYLATIALSVIAIMLLVSPFLMRYALPVLPFLLIWASHGVEQVAEWTDATLRAFSRLSGVARGSVADRARWGICGVVLALTIVGSRSSGTFTMAGRHLLATKEAGIWLRKHQPRVIMNTGNPVDYYADTSTMPLPWASCSLALRYIAKKDPSYVVLNGFYGADARPYLRDWLCNGIPDSRAELVYRTGTKPDAEVAIYRWNGHEAHE